MQCLHMFCFWDRYLNLTMTALQRITLALQRIYILFCELSS